MLSRLLPRSRKPQPLTTRFRPRVEGLEGREVPATWYSQGDTNFNNPDNWDTGQVPGAGEYITFDGSSSVPCTGMSGTFGWVFLNKGYTGTVTLSGSVFTGGLTIQDGRIDQPSAGTDITVQGGVSWTGGVLNGSDNLATVHIRPGSYVGISGNDAQLTLGSTLSFEGKAVGGGGYGANGAINDGTITFRNGADLDVGEFCQLTINPTATVPVKFQNPNPALPSQTNVTGNVTVSGDGVGTQGQFVGEKVPVNVTGGTFKVINRADITLSGQVNGTQGAGSVVMTAGAIAIQHGSIVTAGDNGMKLSGGTLMTIIYGYGAQYYNYGARINGNIVNSGADIVIMADATSRLIDGPTGPVWFGVLTCFGDVTWTGGTYRPVVYGPQGGGDTLATHADLWLINGYKLTIGGTAKVAPGSVGANGLQQVAAAGQAWKIIDATGGIFGSMPGVDPSSAWATLTPWPQVGQPKQLYVTT